MKKLMKRVTERKDTIQAFRCGCPCSGCSCSCSGFNDSGNYGNLISYVNYSRATIPGG